MDKEYLMKDLVIEPLQEDMLGKLKGGFVTYDARALQPASGAVSVSAGATVSVTGTCGCGCGCGCSCSRTVEVE